MPRDRSKHFPLFICFGYFFLSSLHPALASGAIPSELAQEAHALSAPQLEDTWKPLLAALQPEEALQVRFQERRENDFRRGHRTFEGTLRVWRDQGISLHYGGTANVTLAVTPGVFWRRPGSGSWSAYPAAPESGLGEWSEPLWHLNLEALKENFHLFGRKLDESEWELLLTPKRDRNLPRIYLQGNPSAVTRVEVEHNPRRRTVYLLRDADRSPLTDDWDAYFPEVR